MAQLLEDNVHLGEVRLLGSLAEVLADRLVDGRPVLLDGAPQPLQTGAPLGHARLGKWPPLLGLRIPDATNVGA